MKDELLKYLNIKLKYIDDNIDALEKMNERFQEESNSLDYYERSLNLFNDENGNCDIYKFAQIDKENFEKILEKLSDEVKNKFNNDGCSYEGLVYLINGINSGISLKLTNEQVDVINSFIDGISYVKLEHLANIDGIMLAKSNLDIDDLDVLNENKDKYENIIENLNAGEYLKDIDEINNALDFSNVSLDKKIEVYEYILKSNADIYDKKSVEVKKEKKVEVKEKTSVPEEIEEIEKETEEALEEVETKELSIPTPSEDDIELDFDDDFKAFTLPQIDDIKLDDVVPVSSEEPVVETNEEVNNETDNDLDLPLAEDDLDLPLADEEIDLPTVEETSVEEEIDLPTVEETSVDEEINLPIPEENVEVDEDFKDIDDGNSYEEVKEEPISTNKLVIDQIDELLVKYGVKNISLEDKNLLLDGDINNYEDILSYLSETKYLDSFNKNNILLNTLMYSNKDCIMDTMNLIREYLSVDDEDNKVTTDIVIKTMPLVFTLEPNGLYNTFKQNIDILKSYGIDLINLFDNSREIFVCDSNVLINNYNVVSSYGINLNHENAKYLLMLDNVGEKIDYFVEAVYKDSITGNTFDGSELVNLYPVRLNTVRDLTIKRLRYSSETGKKVFGSKEKSLAGEITNLKVDVINMPVDYIKSFFNNEFDTLTSDEVNAYVNIVNNDRSVNMNKDTLHNKLDSYSNGLRYVINNINISKNKVIRIYNLLKKNGITGNKALLFSVCYNLVITKNEYNTLKTTIQSLGDE